MISYWNLLLVSSKLAKLETIIICCNKNCLNLFMDCFVSLSCISFHLLFLPKLQVAKALVDVFAEMIFLHGFLHGDPHPGNILVSPEGPNGFSLGTIAFLFQHLFS